MAIVNEHDVLIGRLERATAFRVDDNLCFGSIGHNGEQWTLDFELPSGMVFFVEDDFKGCIVDGDCITVPYADEDYVITPLYVDNIQSRVVSKPKPRYTLNINIATDQDAILIYEGKEYCWYGQDDLIITKEFDSIALASCFINSEIIVKDDYKATDYVRGWLAYISFGILYDRLESNTRFGNQELSFSITENK